VQNPNGEIIEDENFNGKTMNFQNNNLGNNGIGNL